MPLNECSNLDQYVQMYGDLLARQADAAVAPLYDGTKPVDLRHHGGVELYDAQAHTAAAIAAGWDKHKSMILCGECGVGKTIMATACVAAHARGKPYRALVMCPDHLVKKWAREIKSLLPGQKVYGIKDWTLLTYLDRWEKPEANEWWIIGRNKAKLGPKWHHGAWMKKYESFYRCPDCAEPVKIGNDLATEKQLNSVRRKCTECGAALWEHEHYAGRWSPATYIHQHLKRYWGYFVVDEMHEEKGETTAQGYAMGTLAASCGKVLGLTGTLIGGYAKDLRCLLYRLSPQTLIAEDLNWRDRTEFSRRYGRVDTIVTEKSGGRMDNRQSRGSSKNTREQVKPGIMPTLYGRHLLGNSVFLPLEGVAEGLPALEELTHGVNLPPNMREEYKRIEEKLRNEVKELLRTGSRRLLSAMLQTLLAWPDYPYNWNQVGYTDKHGEWVGVVTPKGFFATDVGAKEQRLIDLVKEEKRLGRQSWVFVQYTGKYPVSKRLEQTLQLAGLKVKYLDRKNVPVAKREDWIFNNGPKYDVIISHPKVVETGLDLFDKKGSFNFSTIIFYETGYHLFTLRQAGRRHWRLAQPEDCKTMYLYYNGTMQEQAMELMGRKLKAALALEGKFTSEGLAAMAGDEEDAAMALARQFAEQLVTPAASQADIFCTRTLKAAAL